MLKNQAAPSEQSVGSLASASQPEDEILAQLHEAFMGNDQVDGIGEAIRKVVVSNPCVDLTDHLKRVLTNKTKQVSNRIYELSLMAVPLVGAVPAPYDAIMGSRQILMAAKSKGIIGIDDGLVILDVPLPRGAMRSMSLDMIYHLGPKLFARGALGHNEEILSLLTSDTKLKNNTVPAAVVVVLVYWKRGTAIPALIRSPKAQAEFGRIVGDQLVFEKSDSTGFDCSRPNIFGCPAKPFLEASAICTQQVLARMMRDVFGDEDALEGISIDLVDEGHSSFQLVMSKLGAGDTGLSLGVQVDEIRDGSLESIIAFISEEVKKYGPAPSVALRMQERMGEHSDFECRDVLFH